MSKQSNLENTLDLLMSHTSIRGYKDEEIPAETLHKIIHTGQHAATSNFLQAYSIIHVTDSTKKKKIATLAKNERQIDSKAHFLLFCADMKRLEHAGKKQGVDIAHDTLENFIVSVVDVALLAQNVVVAAESMGYGICYIGGVRNNPTEISEVVGLPDKVFPVFGMTIGIPDEVQWVKPRMPVDLIVHENQYEEEKYEKLLDDYDQTLSDYYQKRLTNQKDANWTKSMSAFLAEPKRPHMKEFIKSKGFNLK